MNRVLTLLTAALLTACAAPTIRNEVTVFQEWPAELRDNSFVFERTKDQDNNLEYRSYENQIRAELLRLGFREAGVNIKPALKVAFDYGVEGRDVRVIEPVVVSPGWGPPPYYSPFWPYRYYDPFWYGPPIVQYSDLSYRLYRRRLHVDIARMNDGKKLFDVTVHGEGRTPSLAAVMPYMVRSAFADFPGRSGTTRQIDLPFGDHDE